MNLLYIHALGTLGDSSYSKATISNTASTNIPALGTFAPVNRLLHTHKIGMYGIRHGKAGNAIPTSKNNQG